LAIETKSKKFIHDNLDFSTKKNIWYYAFHPNTLPVEDIAKIGIAANDRFGNSFIKRFKIINSKKIFFF